MNVSVAINKNEQMTIYNVKTLYPRRIRSFSCRETRLDLNQKRSFETAWPIYGIEPQPEQMLDLDAIFQRRAPRVIEIGFGDGASLLEMAKAFPERDFIGVEVYRRGIARLLGGIVKHSLNNIRIIFKDAVEVVKHHIPNEGLQGVQIYFADPWPKTRHHKRRLIQADFIQLLSEKLVKAGTIHCATDWENYAQHMMSVLSNNNTLQNKAGEHRFSERPTFRPFTKYEKRAKKVGREIFDLIFERV